MNNNNSNNTIIHIPTCGLWSSCHLASLVLPAPGTHPHIHTAQSTHPAVCMCCCCWLVHKPIFLECCLRRVAGEPGHYTYILLLSNGPIHGIKWSLSARARAHSLTLTVVAKREEDGARGQSSILVNSAETVTVSRDRGPLFSIALEGPIKTNLKLTASKAVMGRVTRPYPYP